MDNIDDHTRSLTVRTVTGRGSMHGLLDVIRLELMHGHAVRCPANDPDVVLGLCDLADQMGGTVEVSVDTEFGLESVLMLPAPELSIARH